MSDADEPSESGREPERRDRGGAESRRPEGEGDDAGWREWAARALCLFGIHDYRLIDVTFGFGSGGNVQRVRCRRCGHATTRSM